MCFPLKILISKRANINSTINHYLYYRIELILSGPALSLGGLMSVPLLITIHVLSVGNSPLLSANPSPKVMLQLPGCACSLTLETQITQVAAMLFLRGKTPPEQKLGSN